MPSLSCYMEMSINKNVLMSLKLNIFWGGQFYKIQCPQMASSITYENIFDFVDTGYETSG